MINPEVASILESVTTAIGEIDRECCTPINEMECGLAYVKFQFKDQALRETGKRLTEETLLAWLVRSKLERPDRTIGWETPYPRDGRKKCDLVIHLSDESLLWFELKLAWKVWFECRRGPVLRNPSYFPYLQGPGKTHSFHHDFEKLGQSGVSPLDYRVVCLIGFDGLRSLMNEEVLAVAKQAQQAAPWTLFSETTWPDRRCDEFRINVWHWVLPPTQKT